MHIHRRYSVHLRNRQILRGECSIDGPKHPKNGLDYWREKPYILWTLVCSSQYPLGSPSLKGKRCHARPACQTVGQAQLEPLQPALHPSSREANEHLRACGDRQSLIKPLRERFRGITKVVEGNEEPEQSGTASQAKQLTMTWFPW